MLTSRQSQRRRTGSRRGRNRLFNAVALLALLVSAILLTLAALQRDSPSSATPGELANDPVATFAILDVGQGLSAAVVTEDGYGLVYDFGRSRDDVEQVIVPFLLEHEIDEIDYAILSHPHQDHVGGLPVLLETLPVDIYLDPVIETTNQTYLQSLRMIASRGITTGIARQGESFALGEHVEVEILWPPDALMIDSDGEPEINENSTVVRVTAGAVSLLLTGDIEQEAEQILTDTYADELVADILQVPHHGSYTSSQDGFLRRVTPAAGIIPVGMENQYGHPHGEAIERLRAHEVEIYRTDVDGTVIIQTDGEQYEITTTRTETS